MGYKKVLTKKRSVSIPMDVYQVLEKNSELEEMNINKYMVRVLRKALNVPVKPSNEKE